MQRDYAVIEAAFIVARFKDSGFGVDIQGLKLNPPQVRAGFSRDHRLIWPEQSPIWTTIADTGHVNHMPDGQITLLTVR